MRSSMVPAAFFVAAVAAQSTLAQPASAQTEGGCGQIVTIATHGNTKTSYSLAGLSGSPGIALVLLPGGGGFLDFDAKGCPRKLTGNSLVRTRGLFHSRGFATALVDAPSDHRGGDGLGGFRISAQHADDIGKVVADVRNRTKLPVWLVGTSRGAISAVAAASRLTGAMAPDGLVLTSAVTSGRVGGQKEWVAQTVFSVRLEAIKMPVLVVVHAADTCLRTPPNLAGGIVARTNGAREQTVTVSGGPGRSGPPSVEDCEGRSPHGFIGQEAEVTAGIARFIRGGSY